MSKTCFADGSDLTDGTPVNADFLNALNNPIFDGMDADGHFALPYASNEAAQAGVATDKVVSPANIKAFAAQFGGAGFNAIISAGSTMDNIATAGNFVITAGITLTNTPFDGYFLLRQDLSGDIRTQTAYTPAGEIRIRSHHVEWNEWKNPLDIGGMLADASNATEDAAINLQCMKIPTEEGVAGQYVAVAVNSAYYTLPAGGTWLVFLLGYISSVGLTGALTTGCYPGGTQIAVLPSSSQGIRGFIWRVA